MNNKSLPIVDHLNRYVSSIEKFISFYKQVLDYELIDQGLKEDGTKYAILKGKNHELFISEKNDYIIDDKNFRHIGYLVENIDELLIKLKMLGYITDNQKVIVKPYSKQIYIKDPDEFEIDLIQWINKDKFFEDLKDKK